MGDEGRKMIVERPVYLKKIEPHIDKPVVKILVGIRRGGKSFLLRQVKELLIGRGAREDQIIYVNFEAVEYAGVRTREQFLELAKEMTKEDKQYYVLLDEVQLVEGWEEVVNGLLVGEKCDIYITGSNSKMLPREISTVLTGRYVNIPVYTLTFQEALEFKKAREGDIGEIGEGFDKYLRAGGFPILHALDYDETGGREAVRDIYNSIVYRDLVERKKVRNTELLGRIISYVFDNVGNVFSARSVVNYLKNEQRTVDPETVYNYLEWLGEVFMVHKVKRYDLRGKVHLKTQEKYYLGDVGLIYALNGWSETRVPGILENIVYLELRSRGYEVSIGKNGKQEVDFVAERQGEKIYVQVAWRISEEGTLERELGAFKGIEDNYPKFVLAMDKGGGETEGIRRAYLPEWLLDK